MHPPSKSTARSLFFACVVLALSGCAAPRQVQTTLLGPRSPARVNIEELPYASSNSRLIRTEHYKIYSTIENLPFLNRLAQLMEGAWGAYQSLCPGIPLQEQPVECYVFANRLQWAVFTQQHTGLQSSVYLKINRGGFTLNDWYVAYYVGDRATFSVAAHEGWHQFAAHNFKGRLPPFLEEGIATTFENVTFNDEGLPRFDVSTNIERLIALRHSVDANQLWPLAAVAAMHAGQIVGQPGPKIEAFYAQAWAFARFLSEFDNGRYRPALRQILADTADGSVFDPTHTLHDRLLPWNPSGIRAVFEHYLGNDFPEIEREYSGYIRDLAVKGFTQPDMGG